MNHTTILRQLLLFLRAPRYAHFLCVVIAFFVLPMAHSSTFDDKASAQAELTAIPQMEVQAEAGDYAAAVELLDIYDKGVAYRHRKLSDRLLSKIPIGGGSPSNRNGYELIALSQPQPTKYRQLLELLAAKGDALQMVALAELESTTDPAHEQQLLTQAAALAPVIAKGGKNAVYTNNSAVPIAQQNTFLYEQTQAVYMALQRLIKLVDAQGDTAQTIALLKNLVALVDSPAWAEESQSLDVKNVREIALQTISSLQAKSSPAACLHAINDLKIREKDLMNATGQFNRNFEKDKLRYALYDRIAMLYYSGCNGQNPPDRAQAYAWFTRQTERKTNEISKDALLAYAELLDNGAPNITPPKNKAFNAYWYALSLPEHAQSGFVELRIAQMLEIGEPYSNLGMERAELFYCRARHNFSMPEAINWLQQHPQVRCKNEMPIN